MGRIRSIKPEFPQSESMGKVSREARLCFILLWTICDDSGRARGASRMLASLLYPYDEDAPSLIDGWLGDLESQGCIRRYEVDGSRYIQICKWQSHQKIDKPSKSKLPPFENPRDGSGSPRERSSEDQGLDQGLDQGEDMDGSGKFSPSPSPSLTKTWMDFRLEVGHGREFIDRDGNSEDSWKQLFNKAGWDEFCKAWAYCIGKSKGKRVFLSNMLEVLK